ncbi:MAG TPA: ATP-binding protein [Thermoanaerobaculia bacterium]|nr:ATP-binding protein [Thermoanaerobaculia bacterium]
MRLRLRFPSRISIRLLLFNVLLVFLPVAGFLYLDVYERELLAAQERAMVQQGRLAAAALAGGDAIAPAAATVLLHRLERRVDARLRVVDGNGVLLADSSLPGPSPRQLPVGRYGASRATPLSRESVLYRIGAFLYRQWQRLGASPEPARETDPYSRTAGPLLGPEVRAALAGRYGASTRPSGGGQRSVTLYSAIPVRGAAGQVTGAVLVSQSTLRLRAALGDVRLGIFRVFLGSVLAAILLSLFVGTTLARPLQRLADEARALADRRGRLLGSFRGSAREDEIGDLARALEELTRRLAAHLRFIESFAADVSHELKNPLAGIRGATELLAEVEEPGDRARFLSVVLREVARMELLLAGVRDITGIDAHLPAEPAPPVDLAALLADLAAGFRLRAGDGIALSLALPAGPPLVVHASPERLAQLFGNVLDNASSFSPPGGTVRVELAPEEGFVRVRVDDQGPGIPEVHRERIFDRFFSWRPGQDGGREGHTGLGLAIARAIAEGYGGSIRAGEGPGGGARLEVRLPASG